MSITFVDRVSTYPNRYEITHEDGTTEYVTLERADEPTVIGTPLNAETFNAIKLPTVSEENNGQILTVVDGIATWTSIEVWTGGSY